MKMMLLIAVIAVLALEHSCEAALSNRKLLQTGTPLSGKVVGSVLCDACLERNFTRNNVLLPGVTVAVTCKAGNQNPVYSTIQETDKQGRFIVDLPAEFSNSEAGSRMCSARVLKGPLGACNLLAYTEVPLSLQAMQQGHRIFTAGPFVYSPTKPYSSCPGKAEQVSETAASQEAVYADEKFPVFGNNPSPFKFPTFPTFPGFPNFGGLPSAQLPSNSIFPPIPTNPPPLFPQFPGFPQFPVFQFPFFPPPPGS